MSILALLAQEYWQSGVEWSTEYSCSVAEVPNVVALLKSSASSASIADLWCCIFDKNDVNVELFLGDCEHFDKFIYSFYYVRVIT